MPAATSAELRRSASSAVMPQWASCRCSSARVGAELLVANSTRTPAPRSRATASSTPGMGCPVSHTTPSRSRTQVPSGGGGHIGPRLTGLLRLGRPWPSWRWTGDELVLHMRALEKAEGVHGDIRVPLSAVTRGPLRRRPVARAARASGRPGTGLPNVIAVGTRRGGFGKDFAAVHGKGPAVVVELDGRRVRAARRHRGRRGRPGAGGSREARRPGLTGRAARRSAVGPGRLEADGAGHVALGDEADDALALEHAGARTAGAGT